MELRYENPSLSMFGLGKPELIIRVFLVSLIHFCSFVLKWFVLVKRFLVKMAKTGHLCFQPDTPSPR